MIPNYGFSPSNIYDFNRNYFTDAALLLCGRSFVILCSGSGHFRFAAHLAACCYVYVLGHQHGRFHSKHTGHINGHTHRHRRNTHPQIHTAFNTRSVPDTNPPAHFDSNLYPNCDRDTTANPNTNPLCNAYPDPDGNGNDRANVYPYTDGDHRANIHRNANADLDTNTYGNPFIIIAAFRTNMKNYGYVQNITSVN
jgi:hypothetical protein